MQRAIRHVPAKRTLGRELSEVKASCDPDKAQGFEEHCVSSGILVVRPDAAAIVAGGFVLLVWYARGFDPSFSSFVMILTGS